jgi:hypothetical protein
MPETLQSSREFYPQISRYNGKKSFQKALVSGIITQDDVNLITEWFYATN